MSEERISVPYVQRIRRHGGRVDLYFRRGGYREGPLHGADGTVELRAEVDEILAKLEGAAKAARPRPGTISGVIAAYRQSDDWCALANSTQGHYGRLANEISADVGHVPLAEVTTVWMKELRNAWALRGHKAAYDRLQVLKNALTEAIADGRISADPFLGLKKVKRPSDAGEPHPVWTDAEVSAAIEDAIARDTPGLARAIAVGRWGGFRRATICALPLHARINGWDEDGQTHTRLYWVTEKRKVLCDKREDARLTALLSLTPNRALTIAYNADGRPYRPRQLNQALDRNLARLAAAGKVRAAIDPAGRVYCPLHIHGLRHSRGVELAEAGASEAEIMSQLEHASDRAAKIYRRQAERRKMADAAQGRVDRVVALRAKRISDRNEG